MTMCESPVTACLNVTQGLSSALIISPNRDSFVKDGATIHKSSSNFVCAMRKYLKNNSKSNMRRTLQEFQILLSFAVLDIAVEASTFFGFHK